MRTATRTRILVADDHAVVRLGVKQILLGALQGVAVDEVATAAETLARLSKDRFDLLILDIQMHGRSGLEILGEIRKKYPRMPVLILTIHSEDEQVLQGLKGGAAGYLTKDSVPDELVTAVKRVLGGGRYLSPMLAEKLAAYLADLQGAKAQPALSDRELEVLRRIAMGMRVTDIAKELALSVKTVSTYRARILEKLGRRTTAELIRYAIEKHL